jgi:hypothetical protein
MAKKPQDLNLGDALATLGVCFDDWPRHTKSKLPPPDRPPDPWMLAALVFDLYRKSAYMYKALRAVRGTVDRALAKEILADTRRIDAAGGEGDGPPDFQRMAEVAHEVMMRLHGEIHDEHERRLRDAAAKSGR